MRNKGSKQQDEIEYVGIHVQDDFIKDQELVLALDALQSEIRPDCDRGASIWSFCDSDTTVPRSMRMLVEHVLSSAGCGTLVEAVEYWSNVMDPGDQVPTHQDKDETLYQTTGKVITPIFSAVYYPSVSGFVGGELELQGVTITPRTNRSVIFAGHLLHRVCQVRSGTRHSIVINGWAGAPMVWVCGKKASDNAYD